MSHYICTWIHLDSKLEESNYTQMGSSSSDAAFQEIYWKCVHVFFSTSIRNNPNASHILFTNSDVLPSVGGISIKEHLSMLNVQVITLPLTFKTPEGYFSSWKNQFYVFDMLKYIGSHFSDEDTFMILDSDCIWVNSSDEIENYLRHHEVAVYTMPFQPDEDIHGLSRKQLQSIFEDMLGVDIANPPHYSGGEWFAAKNSYIKRMNSEVPEIWAECLRRNEQGWIKFNEEAHMLSFIYFKLGHKEFSANSWIRRMWTISTIRRDIIPSDMNLTIWHCPSEKKYGIKDIFEETKNLSSRFWMVAPGKELREFIGEYLGLPDERLRKHSVDQNVRKQIESLRLNDGKIRIFGSGSFGQTVYRLLRDSGLIVKSFIDNDPNKRGQYIEDTPIYGPDDLTGDGMIVIASYASNDIKIQLERMGFKRDKHFVVFSVYND